MKILVIGLGSIGKKHVNIIKSLYPDVQIYALRSDRNTSSYLDVIDIYSLEEIEPVKIDFAIISNPTAEHEKTIKELVPHGFPLFIEKPVSSSLDIENLIISLIPKKIITYVACNLRFLDCIVFLKNKLSQVQGKKRLNEVNVYCGSYLPDWRPNTDFRKSYSAIAELGGGVHIDLIHELDYIYWLFSKPKDVIRNFKSQSSLAISSFDYANYLLDYEEFCVNIILNYYRKDSKRSLELVFEDETWSIDLLKNRITCNNQIIFSSDQQIADTYQIQMEYFINCIKNNENTFNTIINAIDVLKIALGQ